MRPPVFERLLSAAAPHSIDPVQLAVEAINDCPQNARRRRAFLERCAGLESAKGRQTHVTRAPHFSHAELGGAMSFGGLKGPPLLAGRYSFLMDESARVGLHWALLEAAGEMGRAEEWPVLIAAINGDKRNWCEQLVELLLAEDWLHLLFVRSHRELGVDLHPIWLGVSEEIWRAKLMPRFCGLKVKYEGWLARARRNIERGIYEHMHENLDRLERVG